MEALSAILGTVLVVFIPGYAVTLAIFKKDEIDLIERIALSFALSIALVPLLLFYLNLGIGMRIDLASSILIVLLIVFFSWLLWAKRNGRLEWILSRIKILSRTRS